jgi:hypothetical protein
MTVGQVAAKPLIWLVRAYQLVLSPMTPATCRYYPSCSAYAVTALSRHGLFRGTWLTIRRLGRCHPWSPGGVDHVPPLPGQPRDEDLVARHIPPETTT